MNKFKTFIMAASVAFVLAGCEDAEYKIRDNSIYIADAVSSDAKTLVMEGDTEIGIYVRLAHRVNYNVELEIKANPAILDKYNAENATEYHFLPNLQLPDGGKIEIPAGEIGALYKVPVENFDMKGKRYGFSVELGKVLKGENLEVSETLSKYVYLVSKPLITSVPVMKGISGQRVDMAPDENWGITANQWSLECLTNMAGYNKNNQAIFNLGSSEHEIYIRFGDANAPYNYLQIKTLGGQVETKRDLEPDRWYHWAFVYDGTTLTIYRNGEPDVKFEPPAPKGGAVRMDFMQMVSSGSYFMNLCKMSQVRLWKKAITANQIKNNMHSSIDPENPDLIGYWPLNEGSGNSFADITGNGHNATAGDRIISRWEDNVRFDK